MNSKTTRLRYLTLSGLFVAIVFVLTAYLHIPSHTGYIHIGDSVIYLAAALLPRPYAIAVGALGAGLADCLTGYAIWAPGSAMIKATTVLCFSCHGERIINLRNLTAIIPSGILCVGGYYLYEGLITRNFTAPLAGIPGNITQFLFSSILYVVLGLALDKLRFKDRLMATHP